MNEREFGVGGHRYSARKLELFEAAHVARLLTPVLPSVTSFLSLRAGIDDLEALATAIMPLATALAGMSKEHFDFVFSTCLSTVSRQVSGGRGWQVILAPGTQQVMFEDIDLVVSGELVREVLMLNFARFFTASPSASNGGAAAA